MYSKQITIAFSDCDPAGVLFFARYYSLAHDTLESFMSNNEIGWQNWFQNPEIIMPIRHSEADYFAPLWAGKTYDISLDVKKITESSVYFEFLIKYDGRTHCKLKTTHTFADKNEFKKIVIPDSFRHVLEKHLNSSPR